MIAPNDQSLNMEFNDFKPEVKIKDGEKNGINGVNENKPRKESNGWGFISKYLGSNDDLCPLLRVQGLFGITYCGNTPFGKSHSGFKKIGFLLYDSLFIVFFLMVEFIAYQGDTFDRIFRQTSNRGVMNVVFRVSGLAITLEYIVIKTLLLVNGRELYMSIHSIGSLRSSKQMRIVWIYLFSAALIDSMGTTLEFVDFNMSFTEFFNEEKLKMLIFFINGLIHGMAKSSILSVLLYSAFVIRQQLHGNADNIQVNSVNNPQKLCQSMLDMSERIERINAMTGIIMLVKVGTNSILMSGCLCSLALKELDITSKITLSFFLMSSFLDIAVSCRSSQLIINSMNNLCKAIDNHLSLHSKTEQDYRQFQLILSMKEYFKLKVFNLFDLKDVTILVIIGYVANYAVILIQTQSD